MTFIEVGSIVVTWWIVAFLRSELKYILCAVIVSDNRRTDNRKYKLYKHVKSINKSKVYYVIHILPFVTSQLKQMKDLYRSSTNKFSLLLSTSRLERITLQICLWRITLQICLWDNMNRSVLSQIQVFTQ